MTWVVRELAREDAEASRQLGYEAFGMPKTPPTEPASLGGPGRHTFGAFVGPTLAARLSDREYDSCFGGAAVPTAGIASVTVAAEFRGRGALTPLFDTMLRAAKQRGAAISTLFPTAPRIYRRFGYELFSDYVTVSVPTSALAAVAPAAPSTATRRAVEADIPAIRRLYGDWALDQNGPLTRQGASFPTTAAELLADFTGITVAEDATGMVGFASWDRGVGYGPPARIEVSDLLANTPDAHRALLGTIGSFASVAPTTRIDTSGDDPVRLFLPSPHWEVVDSSPYMLKVLDVPLALTTRGYPPGLTCELPFRLAGDVLAENNTAYVLQVADGVARCTPGGSGGATFTPIGLSLLYTGTQSGANLRRCGHLTGGRTQKDQIWDTLFGGRQRHIRNYF